MPITPDDVKKLRGKTGAGMLDCKNALVKASGDFAVAEKILKEQGLANADKRVGKATNNGLVFTRIQADRAVMAELTCETDFVAKNSVFSGTGEKIVKKIVDLGSGEKSEELENMVKEAIAILKENMLLGRIVCWEVSETETVAGYAHNGGQIGVLVKLGCDSVATASKEEVKQLAFNLALHVAAFNPAYINKDAVDPGYLADQKEIFTTQANNIGDKSGKIIKGIVQGKLNKHLSQICLADQGFVKDDKKSVKTIISETASTAGGTIELVDYAYIAVGQDQLSV